MDMDNRWSTPKQDNWEEDHMPNCESYGNKSTPEARIYYYSIASIVNGVLLRGSTDVEWYKLIMLGDC